jgi:hypothetical protein
MLHAELGADLPRVWRSASECEDGVMHPALDPFRPLQISLAGWLNQHQQAIIDYLQE